MKIYNSEVSKYNSLLQLCYLIEDAKNRAFKLNLEGVKFAGTLHINAVRLKFLRDKQLKRQDRLLALKEHLLNNY